MGSAKVERKKSKGKKSTEKSPKGKKSEAKSSKAKRLEDKQAAGRSGDAEKLERAAGAFLVPRPPAGVEDRRAVATDELDARLHASEQRLVALHDRLDRTVVALDETSARVRAVVAALGDLPTSEASTAAGRELKQRLEQLLVAQRRTNELLDLALGVALGSDPGGRLPR